MSIKTVRASLVALSVSATLSNAAMAQYPQYQNQSSPHQQQYPTYQQQYPAQPRYQGDVQYYPYNPPSAAPPSWSYSPYTSGLGPCPQRARGDDRCDETIAPTAGQPNYWVRCDAFGGMPGAQADAHCRQAAVQRAYEYAAAQQAMIEQQIAPQAATRAGVAGPSTTTYWTECIARGCTAPSPTSPTCARPRASAGIRC